MASTYYKARAHSPRVVQRCQNSRLADFMLAEALKADSLTVLGVLEKFYFSAPQLSYREVS